MTTFQLLSKSRNRTAKISQILAPYFNLGDIIVLDGHLGTGKTQFAKGFAEALGSVDLVTSPTFTIAQFYNCPKGTVMHIDAYRLASINEFKDTALADIFPQSIVLIEWGMKIIDELEEYICIKFESGLARKNHRLITFSAYGQESEEKIKILESKLSSYT
ncbi:MAG: tRNA (adenosine(37)-N6)-threonylcarbamoyltransferase complex ATPase subunit type 1 TsaE [Saprospiraceae bacterium]|nr:tRNA (adenosine(37)-N6)-threonylcarbamoyltransferase complex ATPase subunit type 1 TsaE [Saprospiraceae bacterium]